MIKNERNHAKLNGAAFDRDLRKEGGDVDFRRGFKKGEKFCELIMNGCLLVKKTA